METMHPGDARKIYTLQVFILRAATSAGASSKADFKAELTADAESQF